jgi:transposase
VTMTRFLDLFPDLTTAERITLEEMGAYHRYASFRLRAKAILSLNAGYKPAVVAEILGKTQQSVYNWAKWWREDGLVGILNGNKGSPPTKLTSTMLDTAETVAKEQVLTLEGIKRHVRAQHPEAPDFSVRRLSAGLKMRGLSFKRTRMSLKKTEPS